MKIVLLKNVEYDYDAIRKINDDYRLDDYLDGEFVQLSEVIDVEFPMLSEVDITAKKVELIDKDIEKAKAGLYLLEQAKAELLAIPDLSEGRE